MQRFIVLYKTPAAVMQGWMSKSPEERKDAEEKMMAEWDAWLAAHKDNVIETAGAGKTKRVSENGVEDVANDVMLYSIIEAASADEAVALFAGHPHLGIPESTIEIMPSNIIPS